MRVLVNGVRLFFDVEGAGLRPEGGSMHQRPTLILLHGGPARITRFASRPSRHSPMLLGGMVAMNMRSAIPGRANEVMSLLRDFIQEDVEHEA